ncbi:MAG: hypothetical protein ACP5HM_03440 [Anaerolineae bacterium]
MTVKDRNRQLRVVAELLLVHIPARLHAGDIGLTRDLLAVVGTALRATYDDAEQSARAWDKRAYDVKADQLRREWAWALGAANYATGLALQGTPPTDVAVRKLRRLIKADLKKPYRHQITDPARFRGAAQAVRAQQARKVPPLREY